MFEVIRVEMMRTNASPAEKRFKFRKPEFTGGLFNLTEMYNTNKAVLCETFFRSKKLFPSPLTDVRDHGKAASAKL